MRTSHRTITFVVMALAAAGSTAVAPGHPEPHRAPGAVPALTGSSAHCGGTTPHTSRQNRTTALRVLGRSCLNARYAAVERNIRMARATAERSEDGDRRASLTAFLAPGRRFLAFDPRGHGRAVEVIGDLARADRVAVVVPGADGLLINFDSWKWAGGAARALQRQARATDPSARLAVIAWLGYDSPSTRSPAVLTDGRADDASRELTRFLTDLRHVNGRAGVALLCHSYGSVVCAKAAPRLARTRLPVDHIALYGSPGVNVSTASALRTGARIWTGRSAGDWTRLVPKVRIAGIGLGHDPYAPSFGALRFDAGRGPHSAYLRPGSVPLRNLTLIALGRDSEVTHARHAGNP